MALLHVPRPFDSPGRKNGRREVRKGDRFFRSSSADFLKFFRKDVDEAIGKVLVGSLSSTESSLKFTLCD